MSYFAECFTCVLLRMATSSIATSPEIQSGPPASPLSWREVQSSKSSAIAGLAPSANVLGQSIAPRSVKTVEFEDARPYGEARHRTVWLARYDWIAIEPPESTRVVKVPVSLAFDQKTSHLLCAFTDPAPTWTLSSWTPPDIEARASHGCKISPARYETLRSTLPEVFKAMWAEYGVDPRNAGQMIVRPRFVASDFPAKRVNGVLVPIEPPSNVWIVEVLGTIVMRRDVGGEEEPFTTLVAQFRDGDLKFLFATPMF